MHPKKFNLIVKDKINSYKKSIKVDSDKSISIRSFLIGSICNSISIVKNTLESEDVLSTIRCLRLLGVKIIKKKRKHYCIYGKGLGSLTASKNLILNFGNSGTLARLLVGILSTTPNIKVKIRGDGSLNKRSMKKLFNLMSLFGAVFKPKNKFKFPVKLISSNNPVCIKYESGISAQLKSAVILAALNSYGDTQIIERFKSRDHTEKMLENNNGVLKFKKGSIKRNIIIKGKKILKPLNVNVPGDPSSAAFFAALTLMNKDSSIKIKNIGLNTRRTGFYTLLKKHGAKINFINVKKKNKEIYGDISIKNSKLKPIKASSKFYVNSTDEYPILFVLASLINGVSIFNGIGDLTNKESNRVLEMQKVLKQLGIKTKFYKNNLKIFGKGMIDAKRRNIFVPNLGDHRICMSVFILSILTGAKAKIKNFETVFTSSPSFLKIMRELGAKFEIQ